MHTSGAEAAAHTAVRVRVLTDAIAVELSDGRTVTAPLSWYPRLLHATTRERRHWRLVGGGEGVHWPDLDEDISVEGLLAGRPSAESQASLEKWLGGRGRRGRARARS
jgi:hypothetical protein